MAVRGRRYVALIHLDGRRSYLSVPLHWGDVKAIEYHGNVFKKTPQRTDGGWLIFQQENGK